MKSSFINLLLIICHVTFSMLYMYISFNISSVSKLIRLLSLSKALIFRSVTLR